MNGSSTIATIVILAIGLSALTVGTNGWSTWTAEAARRQAVVERPRPLPAYQLLDSRGESLTLAQSERDLTVVDLIYTQCPTVCLAMGAQFRQLQSELATAGLLERVELLSVTFDPANDDQSTLSDYLRRFGAVEPHWRAARFQDNDELAASLTDLGVIVIPEQSMGFVHNAAYYLIENGRVIEIFDIEARTDLFEAIRARLAT
ncbi:MAG: SCO family protein [Pseudomonadales bacterium]|nr:SCO family protein [Pseudomonadales bacterium]MBL6813737.1 SCO family protein [Pseudomonadales bacterium]